MPVRLAELAVRFGCQLRGDPDALVERVASLQEAGPGSIAFLANRRYRRFLAETRATAVVIEPTLADACPVAALATPNPYATYARIAQLLHPQPAFAPGRHASAVVEPGASVDGSAWVGAHAYVAAGATIGPRVFVGPGSMVMSGARVGADSRLVARVMLCERVRVGERCILHPGAVIGADGFGHAPDGGTYVRVPQVGAVSIGDDVDVGANTTIDRGAIGDTVISNGVKIDNQVQIGHNCRIGAHTAIAACVGIAGSTRIGRHCRIGGAAMIQGHIEICDDVTVSAATAIMKSVHKPGIYTSIYPFQEHREWIRNAAYLRHMDSLAEKIKALEKRLQELESQRP